MQTRCGWPDHFSLAVPLPAGGFATVDIQRARTFAVSAYDLLYWTLSPDATMPDSNLFVRSRERPADRYQATFSAGGGYLSIWVDTVFAIRKRRLFKKRKIDAEGRPFFVILHRNVTMVCAHDCSDNRQTHSHAVHFC